ncbi:male determiner protein Nix isoform X1 [Aedes albopictus]|uniref:Nix isoform 2 n=1 Tax=Aedes albopictus TaxID=7160 RepID=A0A650AWH0_AEDAL|nr:Nix isoform 2 [Aedes albopictus]
MYSKSELNLINNQFEYIKKYCIYIGNIPAEVSKTDLIAKFSVFGEISNLYMKSFIQFCDVKPAVVRYRLMKSVKESSSLHNSRYIQSVLIVLPLDSSYNNYFLPYNTCVVVYTYNKFGMVDFYQKFSKLGDIHAMKKATNVMVYISFVSERAARTILDTKPTDIHINVQTINHVTRNINVCLIDFEKECTSNTAIKLTLLYNRSIGIFGLPSNFTEAKLHDEFSSCGPFKKFWQRKHFLTFSTILISFGKSPVVDQSYSAKNFPGDGSSSEPIFPSRCRARFCFFRLETGLRFTGAPATVLSMTLSI